MTPEKAINLSQWVESYTAKLYLWTYYKLSDSEQAKDLVQNTFLATAKKIDEFHIIKTTSLKIHKKHYQHSRQCFS